MQRPSERGRREYNERTRQQTPRKGQPDQGPETGRGKEREQ